MAADKDRHPSGESTAASSSAASSSAPRVRLVECGPLSGGGPQALGHGAGRHVGWAMTPTRQWIRVRSTTAIVPNRERDKQRVENALGLPEFGDQTTEFYAVKSGLLPVALGYDRVVYGDHGPYVELSSHQICWPSFPRYEERPSSCFFDECWTEDGLTMLYAQKRAVSNKPNPPAGPWAVQNNRKEGYANYLIGKFYIACDADTIYVQRVGVARRRRRAGRGRGRGRGGSASVSNEVDGAEPDGSEQGLEDEPAPGEQQAEAVVNAKQECRPNGKPSGDKESENIEDSCWQEGLSWDYGAAAMWEWEAAAWDRSGYHGAHSGRRLGAWQRKDGSGAWAASDWWQTDALTSSFGWTDSEAAWEQLGAPRVRWAAKQLPEDGEEKGTENNEAAAEAEASEAVHCVHQQIKGAEDLVRET